MIIGASFRVVAPWSQYDDIKLVNLGTNNWAFKPQVGISKAIGAWTLEGTAAVTFFTDNHDFFGGNTLSQDPLYSLQGHLIYGFRSGIWASVDATYFVGGRTAVNGVLNSDLHSRTGVSGRPWRFQWIESILRQQGRVGAHRRTATTLSAQRGSTALAVDCDELAISNACEPV